MGPERKDVVVEGDYLKIVSQGLLRSFTVLKRKVDNDFLMVRTEFGLFVDKYDDIISKISFYSRCYISGWIWYMHSSKCVHLALA